MGKFNRNDIIRINVGGKIYMTTLKLICQYKNSYLYEIVLEKLKEKSSHISDSSKKEIFIDRNGNRFEYILDFLRDGVLICENDITLLTKILIEAIYFKLFSLIKIIKKKIYLLYSNMDNIINKNILNGIINSIEKKGKMRSNRMKKITEDACYYGELKYFNVKKKKRKSINFLNTINHLNELEKENSSIDKYLEGNKNEKDSDSINSLEKFKKENEIIPNEFMNFEKNHKNNENNKINVNNKENEKINGNGNLSLHNLNSTVEYNMTNNFTNNSEKVYSKNYIPKNYFKINNKKDNCISLENAKLKNVDLKSVTFSENNKLFLYNNNDYSSLNGSERAEGYRGYHLDINNKNHTSNNNNNYKYDMNKSKNHIFVYSEIDDVEETSHFPIVSNINLGEQIFSTTVDF